ncbi:hypothetical protein NEOLEDRAFT_557023 [Neolentinus lepideus HHB14362 ss-1]|uniref:Uncharacterized protein n=1 Tax=Neolentinus lepideus HHB14362 ss-1 TaxID=1314782 RepID=A0A165R5E2_9AGAM|nr:hypothetical protein NEOLEDRAFT_557023 [Neolentinus lepideus HHB14362 ss-1]
MQIDTMIASFAASPVTSWQVTKCHECIFAAVYGSLSYLESKYWIRGPNIMFRFVPFSPKLRFRLIRLCRHMEACSCSLEMCRTTWATPSLNYLVLDAPVRGTPVARDIRHPHPQHLELCILSRVGATFFDWIILPAVKTMQLKIGYVTVDEVEKIFTAVGRSLNTSAAKYDARRCAVYQESAK